MLFNSFEFIFVFLPAALLAWFGAKAVFSMRGAAVAVIVLSIAFYAYWEVRFLPVLLGSIGVNYWISLKILARRLVSPESARAWCRMGIAFNLGLLGIFKYSIFVIETFGAIVAARPTIFALALPLGISFITFQKIAYLVDCRDGKVTDPSLWNYMFFVTFFPQLIAGPIVHHRYLTEQLSGRTQAAAATLPLRSVGLWLFSAGLCKKVVLADSLARYVSPVFEAARYGIPSAGDAWVATLAYALQLYFDFSGYSDMAIGLALLFGLRLPVNFHSPYRATSLIEFWHRWHISLSTFLRRYLYVPLGGNRHGILTKYRNILITMFLAGLWHGAGWTFILWGAVHGIALVVNHVARDLSGNGAVTAKFDAWDISAKLLGPLATGGRIAAWGATFSFVVLAWVLFRASDLESAARMYSALLSVSLSELRAWPAMTFDLNYIVAFLAARPEASWGWITVGLIIALLLPNSIVLAGYRESTDEEIVMRYPALLGAFSALNFWIALKWLASGAPSEFLYFNF